MTGIRSFIVDFQFVLGDARRQVPAIFALFLFAALLDLCGLGLVLPLITALTVPGSAFKLPLPLGGALELLDLNALALGVVVVYVARAIVAYRVQRAISGFSEGQRGQLMTRLLDSYLRKPYEFHLERNSAVLINNTITLTGGYAAGVLSASLRLATDAVTFVVIIGFLAWTNWQIVVAATGTIGLVLAAYNLFAKRTLRQSGEAVAVAQGNAVRVLTHGLGAIREMRVLGVEQHAVQEMQLHAQRLSDASGRSAAIQVLPRYLIETALIVLLAVLAILVHAGAIGSAELVPKLGLFAIAAIRLMPGTTSMIGSINTLRIYRYGLRQLAEDLKVAVAGVQGTPTHVGRPSPSGHDFRGFQTVQLQGVGYSYPVARKPALQEVTLTIRAGQAIGIIGRTGSGKSTLADLILGLIQPQAGRILVDGQDIHGCIRAWMNELAYIPQAVFIKDDTLRANIAFGVAPDNVNADRLKRAVADSQLEEVLRDLPQGYDTMLGERGARLSGGQRQRVALARALYHDRQLIVMDEATAALDTETEREVIRAIRTLHGVKTLIIIAHRLSTLEGCDLVVQLDAGRILRSGSYAAIVGDVSRGAVRA